MLEFGSYADDDPIYYRIYKLQSYLITVVCMQYHDEKDYDQTKFVKNSKNEVHTFETEQEAKEKLNEWYPKEKIDPQYYIDADPDLIRD